ncbi:MAG: GNAT family N-acetyltransferase [Planctomycetota bacterium]|jgi:putative acetyltransferase|nr:GNAT family N-acetyltransferase [Planctomycetota bacterium]
MITPLTPTDLSACRAIYRNTVRALGPSRYSPTQVAAWSAFADHDDFVDFVLHDHGFGYRDHDALLGFASIAVDGYIKSLYVAAEAGRRGIASQLLHQVMAAVDPVAGYTTVASQFSRPLFARHGFVVETEETTLYNEVSFVRWRMRCPRQQ